ncbi:alpha-L-arabinofuranosidase C-terminal domain-containing protein [Mucilaginibacter sp. KACC 22063]|uniref:alpha-L-arabinofuranosidase C-terminal domain-containing protein n=1 Tax=Mucilaginibacter sp. KACC 22063 TaxID=3025666 RepID=UPI00236673FC|nr:alpha-L-arabinofuranosidase C-terminal domain-containing protein [Mucilaginibacter sp. KACC 22063]WDF57416.1 alpha-L-arabinofuranosidase C-terminal domain-containing protein [Mucilaginibacter sp. KACC 22063]
MRLKLRMLCYAFIASLCPQFLYAQQIKPKPISKDLFGVFFEDLSYAADGGLYAELIQNRSFEYSPADKKEWNPLSFWEYTKLGHGYGKITVESISPIAPTNPHYVLLDIDYPGTEGVGITNSGFDGITLHARDEYDFSVYIKQIAGEPANIKVELIGKKDVTYGHLSFNVAGNGWKKYTGSIIATANADSAKLSLVSLTKGKIAIDEVSLFPRKTFKGEKNGLRADLAQAIADLKPKFMRFPGGCLVHGDGVDNIYRWKKTIGPVEFREQDRNIWNYHQSFGLGFFEYFRFCEDIGAKPLPVIAAAVSCQNSGTDWGKGQRPVPESEMQSYIQDILDLIEYANGPVTSEYGAKRAAAGHPKPFNLEYIGIGNEDKQTDNFRDRFKEIYEVLRAKHPEITIVGTVGPSPAGEDYELGWKFADKLNIPVVDEHFYEKPEWFLKNNKRYDGYRRPNSKVYIGEYASWGNNLINALSEAAFMTSLERNGDVVKMASYAPLLANVSHISWNPDLIYFNNKTLLKTANYYVQQLFSTNQGDLYIPDVVAFKQEGAATDSTLAASCVKDSHTGDIILKIVNAGSKQATATLNLKGLHIQKGTARVQLLTGLPTDKNSMEEPNTVHVIEKDLPKKLSNFYTAAPYSVSVIRFKAGKL